MADFVLLYTGGSMPEGEAEIAKVMQAWTDWYTQIGGALKDGGNPFTPAAKTIASDGSQKDGAPGPLATGYTIVTADSLAAATDIAKGSPVLHGGGSVTVYETFEAM
ncbi:MAG: hypothetical protein ACRDHU_07050 [Actinomycetota bacterium]